LGLSVIVELPWDRDKGFAVLVVKDEAITHTAKLDVLG
jgi:hypothetical protein